MKKMKYGMTAVCLAVGMMLAVTACGGKKTESTETETQTAVTVETQTESETETEAETEAALPAGEMYSYLTGEPVSETIGKQRPYAIMINNIDVSLPQSGVSQAEMIYEAQVEGGITRLLALFQDVDNVEKIGSVRSARHNYIDFAMIMMLFMYTMVSQGLHLNVLKMRILRQFMAYQAMNRKFFIVQRIV